MRCPHCGERETRVVDSRDLDDAATIRRRRECAACSTRFTTYERVEAARLVVVKSDGVRQEFDREKLATGLRKALTRRPVPDDGRGPGRRRDRGGAPRVRAVSEVPSAQIGALAMEQLRELDQIAYIRFASVYQSFEDLEALKREVDLLYNEPRHDRDRRPPGRRPLQGPPEVSVLSDRDIRAAARGGRVGIRPYDPADLQPSSVDLHLDRSFRVFRNNRYPYIDVRAPQPDLTELLTIADDEPFILHPGEFVLGQTLEWVELPDDLVARLEGKSSLGRLGPADPLDRGLRRPGLEGQPHARALERREPADRALLRHEDRPDLVLQDVEPGRAAVWLAGARLEVPGPVGADRIGVPPRLLERA